MTEAMKIPERPSMDLLRAHLAELAAQADQDGAAAVEAANCQADDAAAVALDGITRAAEIVRGTTSSKANLGPLWPGNE